MAAKEHLAPLPIESLETTVAHIEHAHVDHTKRKRRSHIPVLMPQLPSAAALLPYLQKIDLNRWYSNHGPLTQALEKRLAQHLGCGENELVTVSNATAGITAALMVLALEPGLCILPSYTFVATAHAVKAAGLTPWFHDVDQKTWALDPTRVKRAVQNGVDVKAVVVVAPFGAPLDLNSWLQFQEETGIPVVIDAAAGFDTVRPCGMQSVVSLHATKVFGAGEGGFIVTGSPKLSAQLRACCNFGFQGSRSATQVGLNAKLSEYHAAVGLAHFAQWPSVRLKHLRIMRWYQEEVARLDGVSLHPGYGDGWVTATTSVILPPDSAGQVAESLRRSGVETRSWWGQGCHTQPAFATFPHGDLVVTDELGGRVLGLPHFTDMERDDVAFVMQQLAKTLRVLKRRS